MLRSAPKILHITLIWDEHLCSPTPQASLVLTGRNSWSPGNGLETHSGGTEPAPPTCWEPRLTRKRAFQLFQHQSNRAQGRSCKGCAMRDPVCEIRRCHGTQALRRTVSLSRDEGGGPCAGERAPGRRGCSFACRRQLRGLEKNGICIIINIYFTLSLLVRKASQGSQNFK